MDIYRIRLKNRPDRWVGKKSPSYALVSDKRIAHFRERYPLCSLEEAVTLNAHWFVKENTAKVWTSVSSLRRFLAICREGKDDTFSQYEVLNGENVVDFS